MMIEATLESHFHFLCLIFNPCILTTSFHPCHIGPGTDEQIGKCISVALRHAIFGCYAQTKLGRDSDVAGLITTATYDRQLDKFVLHSPALTVKRD
jgi:acyl-CoA oxidase